MRSTHSRCILRTRIFASSLLPPVLVLASLGLSGGAVPAAEDNASPRVTENQATEIALKAVPGDARGVTIERKRGKNVYVVEIVAKKDGVETDVFVDLDSGKVLGTEK